jgi:signal transduction histidine kinase
VFNRMTQAVAKIKYIIVIIGLLLGPLLIIPYVGNDRPAPGAVKGVIDLSAWDFSTNETTPLNGEWEFYWNQLVTTADFIDNGGTKKPDLTGYVVVPHLWQGNINGTEIQSQGIATYRLVVKVPQNQYSFGIKTEIIRVTSRLLVNGLTMGGCGAPELASSLGENAPENVPYVAYFTSRGEQVEIILQVANYAYANGGIPVPVRFGSQDAILALTRKINSFELVAFGFLCSGSLYHIGVFLFGRRREKSLLYFGLFCLAFAVVDISLGQKLLNQFISGISFVPMHKLRHISTAAATVLITLFLRQVLLGSLPEKLTKGIVAVFGSYAVAALVLPHGFINVAEKIFFPLSMGVFAILIILLAQLLFQKKYGSLDRTGMKLLILGVWCLWMYDVVNILYVLYLVIDYRFLGDLALLLFLLFMSYMLAIQYANAYHKIEDMSVKLQEQDKAKDIFLTNTSHEFRTPLNGIIHMTQAVLEEPAGSMTPQQQEKLSLVVAIAQRLSILVTDILDFEKIKTNDISLNIKPIELHTAVDSVVEVFRHINKNSQVNLTNRVPIEMRPVMADENRLRQVLYNLIGNALKFTSNGEISVSAKVDDGSIVISVKDSGLGIPSGKQEEIFQSFEQVSAERAEKYGGTGLGLAITRQLVERMNGKVWVAWSEIGQGTEIAFCLPTGAPVQGSGLETGIQTNYELLPVMQPEILPQVLKEGAFTLLAVDDDLINLQVMVNIFEKNNYSILSATTGIAALKAIKENSNVDVVLLDVMMRDMTGYEVCRQLRQQYSLFELPILLITARSLPDDVKAGFAAGANDFVVKPFNADELRARVATQLALKKAARDVIRAEVAFLQSQIKPHFFYNVLNTIVSLCYTDSQKAGNLLTEFSNYLRSSFDIKENLLLTSLEKELNLVKSYVVIEQARFGERLKVSYDIDAEVLSCKIPPLIIQPLVENAVRHGLMGRESGGYIAVTAHREDGNMVIRVSDDGVGIPADMLPDLLSTKQEGAGVGLQNINRRLLSCFGKSLSITSQSGEGTMVTMTIPLNCSEIVQNHLA